MGRLEFLAPELSGVDLARTPRGKSSDLFALAVHIHVLLMGVIIHSCAGCGRGLMSSRMR